MTTYKSLYNSVYSKLKDYDLAVMEETEADEIMHDYLRPAIISFECCNQELNDRDEENACFNFDLTDINFEILSNFMLIHFLDSTYIRTSLMLKAHMSTTDFHKFDNKDVLSKVTEVRQMYHKENKQLMINYSLCGDNEFSKLYDEKGSYSVDKRRNAQRNGIYRRCCKGGLS